MTLLYLSVQVLNIIFCKGMEAANVLLIGIIISFVLGSFIVYRIYLYTVTVKSGGRDKNYYYNRFMRNKEQVERYIESLQHSITLFNCGDEKINTGDNLTVQDHLSKLRNDYDNDYAEVTQKILKRTINRKDKKVYQIVIRSK